MTLFISDNAPQNYSGCDRSKDRSERRSYLAEKLEMMNERAKYSYCCAYRRFCGIIVIHQNRKGLDARDT